MRKCFIISITVLALSGCVYEAATIPIRMVVDGYKNEMKEKEREKERQKEREWQKKIGTCTSKICKTFCFNTLDDCNKKAKARCEGQDFRVVEHNIKYEKYHEKNTGDSYNELLFSCKKVPKERRSSK